MLKMQWEWGEADVLRLIKTIKQYPCVYDLKSKDKKDRKKTNDVYRRVGMEFGKTQDEIKRKFASLLQSYRVYRRRVERSKKLGSGQTECYKPNWFAYQDLDEFMNGIYKPQRRSDSMDEINEECITNEYTNVEENDVPEQECLANIKIEIHEEESEQNLENTEQQQSLIKNFSSPKNVEKRRSTNLENEVNPSIEEAYAYLLRKRNGKHVKRTQKDECEIYGELLAVKLRKFDEVKRQCLMNTIDNLIFEATINSAPSSSKFTIVPQTSLRRN